MRLAATELARILGAVRAALAVARLQVRLVRVPLIVADREVGLHDSEALPYTFWHVALSAHRRVAAGTQAATLLLTTAIQMIQLVAIAHLVEW